MVRNVCELEHRHYFKCALVCSTVTRLPLKAKHVLLAYKLLHSAAKLNVPHQVARNFISSALEMLKSLNHVHMLINE